MTNAAHHEAGTPRRLFGPTRWALAALLLAVCAGCPPPAIPGAFQITNVAPGVVITHLYLVPAGSTNWGQNLLFLPVEYGESAVLPGIPSGYYDELAIALFPSSGNTQQLVNEGIRVPPGGIFTHTVHYQPDWP